MSHAWAGVVTLSLIFAACAEPARVGSVESERVDEKSLTLVLKVPPKAGVASHPGLGPPVYADAQGKVELVLPIAVVPPGKAKITVHVQPVKGDPYSFDYFHEREARLTSDGGSALPSLEGIECTAFLGVDPRAQVVFQGCPAARHFLNGKPLGQGQEPLAFGDVLGELPLDKLLPLGAATERPTVEVQVTAVTTGASAHGRVQVAGDWRTGLRDFISRNVGKPMLLGGDELLNDHNLALISAGGLDLVVVGAGPLRELDLVAVYEPKTGKPPVINCATGPCSADGGKNDLVLAGLAADVTLYDRRTGAVVEKKSFPAGSTAACADALKAGLSNGAPASMVEVIKWVEGHLAVNK